jgi:hypothetical protein
MLRGMPRTRRAQAARRGEALRALVHDIGDALSFAVCLGIALLPRRLWPPLADALARAGGGGRRKLAPLLGWERAALAEAGEEPGRFHRRESLRERILAARAIVGLPLPPTRVEGDADLRRALARGRGAVLWVAHARDASVMTKVAMARRALRAHHLSRTSHGFWRSRFGARVLNRLVQRAEDRHLAGRVFVDGSNGPAGLRPLVRALKEGKIVSVRLGAETARPLERPFLGETLRLPPGPVRMAQLAGAPLFAVTTVRQGRGYVTRVSGPITTDGPVEAVMDAFLQAIETAVRGKPLPFVGQLPR